MPIKKAYTLPVYAFSNLVAETLPTPSIIRGVMKPAVRDALLFSHGTWTNYHHWNRPIVVLYVKSYRCYLLRCRQRSTYHHLPPLPEYSSFSLDTFRNQRVHCTVLRCILGNFTVTITWPSGVAFGVTVMPSKAFFWTIPRLHPLEDASWYGISVPDLNVASHGLRSDTRIKWSYFLPVASKQKFPNLMHGWPSSHQQYY